MKIQTISTVFSLLALGAVATAAAQSPRKIEGVTEAYRNIVIKASAKRTPPWNSRIAQIVVEEGDQVEVGQILIELDKVTEELEAKSKKLIAEDTTELKNAVDKEQTLRTMLESSREVYRTTKSVTRDDLNQRTVALTAATADRQRVELAKKRDQVEAELAALSLSRQTIKSPIRGTVLDIYLREGESCDPGEALMRIVDTTRGYLIANVEEKVGRSLKKGDNVEVSIQKGEGFQETAGTIVFVSPIVDPSSGLMQVRAEFANPDGSLKTGVRGSILLKNAAP